MDPEEYGRMFRIEQIHWWYLGMAKITRAILDKWFATGVDKQILDAGCGTGSAMASYLSEYGKVIGFDLSPIALKFCRERGLTALTRASVMQIPFKTASFDLITSFDVLYEQGVQSDLASMGELFRVLRPDGLILIRLPAYDWLRGQHDLTVHTARRYTVSQAKQLLKGNGFSILHASYANTFLFPLAVAKRLLERIYVPAPHSSDLSVEAGIFNGLLKNILCSEAALVSSVGLPFGLSVVVLAKKPHVYE